MSPEQLTDFNSYLTNLLNTHAIWSFLASFLFQFVFPIHFIISLKKPSLQFCLLILFVSFTIWTVVDEYSAIVPEFFYLLFFLTKAISAPFKKNWKFSIYLIATPVAFSMIVNFLYVQFILGQNIFHLPFFQLLE